MIDLMAVELDRHYVGGRWAKPLEERWLDIAHPGDGAVCGRVALGGVADIERAVQAARVGFTDWSLRPQSERTFAIKRLLECYRRRWNDLARAITTEMGVPITLSRTAQVGAGEWHIQGFLAALEGFDPAEACWLADDADAIIREPIGVCGLITPWNWPMNQIALKVVPAIATGCSVVLKPSELAPISASIFAEVVEEADLPPGVFNLVQGDGAVVGEALSRHPDVDMMSFTGSTRAGAAVSRAAANSIKRVALELGGKSPNVVFSDVNLEHAVTRGVRHCFENSGQSCNAPTRMLVERTVYARAVQIAADVARSTPVGNPLVEGEHLGPVASAAQHARVLGLLRQGVTEGAKIVAGGVRPIDGMSGGWFVRPTVFADVAPAMRISTTELFGPVLTITPFEDEENAIRLANASEYGLAAYVETTDQERAGRVARRLRAGMVHLNGTPAAQGSPFGGYKRSGVGREGGRLGLEEFLEIKAVSGLMQS